MLALAVPLSADIYDAFSSVCAIDGVDAADLMREGAAGIADQRPLTSTRNAVARVLAAKTAMLLKDKPLDLEGLLITVYAEDAFSPPTPKPVLRLVSSRP